MNAAKCSHGRFAMWAPTRRLWIAMGCVFTAGLASASGNTDSMYTGIPSWALPAPGNGISVPDRLLIRVRSESLHGRSMGRMTLDNCPGLKDFASKRGVRESRPILVNEPDSISVEYGLNRDMVVELRRGSSIEEEIKAWNARPEVEWAEPDWVTHACVIPNDSYFPEQWGLRNTGQAPGYGTATNDIRAYQAWDLFTGSPAIKIAIVDTGVSLYHPDLQAKIVSGYDIVNNDGYADDDNGHGTAVASLAAGISNNALGVTGVDWQARIMPLKVLGANGSGSTAAVVAGIDWARTHGANVINMSLGSPYPSDTQKAAVDAAYASGVVVVAAAGNNNSYGLLYPAGFDNCLSVGASQSCVGRAVPGGCGVLGWGSNYGPGLDVIAPGDRIRMASLNAGYTVNSGTSMASPLVAGVASLLKGRNPALSVQRIYSILRNTAIDLWPTYWDVDHGCGQVNAYDALRAAFQPTRTLTMYATNCSREGSTWANLSGANGPPQSDDNQNESRYARNDVGTNDDILWADNFNFPTLMPGERITGVYINVSARYDMNTSNNKLRLFARHRNDLGQTIISDILTPTWSQSSSDDNFQWRMTGLGWDITNVKRSWTQADLNALDFGVRRNNNNDAVSPKRCRITAFRITITTSYGPLASPEAGGELDGRIAGIGMPALEEDSAPETARSLDLGLKAYPNPFNPSTTLSYKLASPSSVRVMLYDLTGRLVRILDEGDRQSGQHELHVGSSNLSSGTYFVQVQTDEGAEFMKIVLLK